MKLLMNSLSHFVQGDLEKSMEESKFIFDSVQMYCKCYKVNFSRVGSYIDSPDWNKKKKATINSINGYDKCFQYVVKVDWKTFEKNNPTIALNILYIKEKEICPSYISITKLKLWVTNNSFNDSKWRKRRLALSCGKELSKLLRGITWKHGDLYCLNCLHSVLTENKPMKKYVKINILVEL